MHHFMRRGVLYQRLKASWLYDAYWTLADKSIIEERDREVQFYRSTLDGFRKGGLIFDVGANHGYKSDIFLRLGARVVAIDPDPENLAILTQRFLSYRLQKKPVTIVCKAVGDTNSIERMWIDTPGSAKNTLSDKWAKTLREDTTRFGASLGFTEAREVVTTTLADLVATHGFPFFVKIDVEGYELAVLRGMRAPVPYLSFEVNLPEFRQEGVECIDILARLSMKTEFNYVTRLADGLLLTEWLRPEDFATVLSECCEGSIEVFCRTNLP